MKPVPADRAATLPMMEIPLVGEAAPHNAPTVPMKPIRLPLEDTPAEAAVPAPEKAPKKAPPAPQAPAPRPTARPADAPRQQQAPAGDTQRPSPRPPPAAGAAQPVVVVVQTGPGSTPPGQSRPPASRQEAPAAPSAPPASPGASASNATISRPPRSAPPTSPAEAAPANAPPVAVVQVFQAPKPEAPAAQQPREAAPADAPRKPGQSTSVMLRAGKLHKLVELAEEAKKNARLRKAEGSSARPSIPLSAVKLNYDGTTPADGVSLPRPEQLVVAPVQSYPGQRTVIYTQNVINQYAVAANPRYALRSVEPREAGHLFVFDVMSSLHTSLGRAFPTGAPSTFRPGTLKEVWKWLSEAAREQGWRSVEGSALLEAMGRGLPIIAMAETPFGPRLAVVEPRPPGPGGKPRLASAYEPRGQGRTPEQVFGSAVVRYLAHE